MKTKWENLFWFQRHNDAKKAQLENNTTKNFFKTLAELRDSYTAKFLAETDTVSVDDLSNAQFSYALQENIDNLQTYGRDCYVIGLSFYADPQEGNSDQEGGIVDGVIIAEREEKKDLLFAIEVKTETDRLNESQLEKYRRSVGAPRWETVTWGQVYSLFDSKRGGKKENFLKKEFNNYLELMQMVPFQGFDRNELKKGGWADYVPTYFKTGKNKGTFVLALEEILEQRESPLEDFSIDSNKTNTQLHLKHPDHKDNSFTDVNHFTIGFWKNRLVLQLNIRKAIASHIYSKTLPATDAFKSAAKKSIEATKDTEIHSEKYNPLVYVAYSRNIQQKRNRQTRDTTSFPIVNFAISPHDMKDVDNVLDSVAAAVKRAKSRHIGTGERNFNIHKRIPFSSNIIESKELPEHCIGFLERLYPLYEHFEE